MGDPNGYIGDVMGQTVNGHQNGNLANKAARGVAVLVAKGAKKAAPLVLKALTGGK
ncbi:hypothetical protein OG381_48490 (plasmid) [Streptomyces sp. NBC_00490]|uniref:hypothetical protein n=1 Tax=Streptomyces sp. NBC_00490 TaxID=2903657 RepID=UPI002E171865